MRRISTGLTRVGFDQDPSPLTEGMLHAASTLGELWPRLKQIEMEKNQHQDSVDERNADRATHDRYRTEDAATHDRYRTDDAKIRKQERDDAAAERADAHRAALGQWAAGFGVGDNSPDVQGDVAARVESDRQRKLDEHAASSGTYNGEDQGLLAISARSQEHLGNLGKMEEKALNKPDFKPNSTYNQSTGWHKGEDGVWFRTDANNRMSTLDLKTNTVKSPEDIAKEKADTEAAAAAKAADDKLVANENSQNGLWTNGRMPWNDSRDVVLARAQAKQANANRPADQLWPSTPSNLPPGVTPDDPHGTVAEPRVAPDSESQPADEYVIGMHELAQKDPARFKASLLDLKAKNPSAYAATAKRLREMDGATGAK